MLKTKKQHFWKLTKNKTESIKKNAHSESKKIYTGKDSVINI